MPETHFSRRTLMATFAAAGLRALPLSAAGSSNRALVCIYLFGGNDSNNMLVPLGAYDSYAGIRGRLAPGHLAPGHLAPACAPRALVRCVPVEP